MCATDGAIVINLTLFTGVSQKSLLALITISVLPSIFRKVNLMGEAGTMLTTPVIDVRAGNYLTLTL